MPKLATPVLYEDALQQLNEIRPLKLADEVKQGFSLPVLCTNTPNAGKPAIGRLAQSNNRGSLIAENSGRKFDNAEFIDFSIPAGLRFKVCNFSQRVLGVHLFWVSRSQDSNAVFWCAADSTKIKQLVYQTWMWLPFIGTRIYFIEQYSARSDAIWIYGLYN